MQSRLSDEALAKTGPRGQASRNQDRTNTLPTFSRPLFCYGGRLAAVTDSGVNRAAGTRRLCMLKEFQEFISKGNVMDLAVGVIIGGAFGLIVNSLVGDIIMPVVGAIFGGFDFSNYFLPLSSAVTATSLEEARRQGAVFAYGNFLTVVINFMILAWIIFLMVKGVNNLRRRLEQQKEDAPPAPPPADVQLLTEIRDLLAKR
jgi:large conductance mechanosensitive channel